MRHSTVPLILLAALSFFAGLGRGPITDADEAFYAESAREMVESGDWLTPHYNYQPRFQKPALYYWLTATLYLATGPNELAARFWSALAGIGLVLVTAACARRWCDDGTGLLAGAIAATSFGYFAMARMALPDLPLAFFITLTIYAALVATLDRVRSQRPWLLLAATAAALGFLMKGPVATVIPALVVVPVLLIERRSLNVRFSDFALSTLLFMAIAAPWYVGMWMEHGAAYFTSFFVGDNYERFATSRFNDPRPWWFYLPIVAGGLFPWTALLLVWLSPIWRFMTRRRDIDTLELRLLLWAALPLVFFTLSVGKQPRYILPVLPPLAILLASSILERTRDWRSLDGARVRPRASMAVVLGTLLAGASLVALAALVYRARVLFVDVGDQFTIGSAVVIGALGIVVMLLSVTSAWRAGPGLLAVAAAVTFAVLPYGVLAAPSDAAVRQLARVIQSERRDGEAIATYQVFVRNLVYYTESHQTDLIHDEHVADWIDHHPHALIALRAEDLNRVEAIANRYAVQFHPVAQLPYFDDGGIRLRTLLWPNRELDLSHVVLVRASPQPGSFRTESKK